MKRWLVILIIGLLIAIGVSGSAAQEGEAIDPALGEMMAQLEVITATLRDLPAKEAVIHQYPTREETIEYLEDVYNREIPPEEFERIQRFYVALDLLPPDIDLRDVYLNLLGSQVAGFYDPDTKTMNVIPLVGDDPGASLSFTEQIIYVHEFTHALQDQYFDLNALLESPEVQDNPDRALAVTSLVEGDATAIMTLYSQEVAARNPFAVLGMLVEGLQAGNLILPEGIPSILVTELTFPYEGGVDFVVAVFEDGGWEAVNAAFGNPPTTSEQVLHPEKYLAGEGAQEVELADDSAVLGEGWTNVWDSPLGEFYLREHLETQLDSATAAEAAAGWGGDHFRIYADAAGQMAWELKIAWDDFGESAQFLTFYEQFGSQRYDPTSRTVDGCWEDDTSALCFVFGTTLPEGLITSAPTLEQARALAGLVAPGS